MPGRGLSYPGGDCHTGENTPLSKGQRCKLSVLLSIPSVKYETSMLFRT